MATGTVACVASVPERHEQAARKRFSHLGRQRKMEREQKGGKSWMGEGKEGNACPQTP